MSCSRWCFHTRCRGFFFHPFRNCSQKPRNQKNNKTHNGPANSLISSASCSVLLREKSSVTQAWYECLLLFGARIRCFAEGMFPFKAQRAAWGRAAPKSPELSSALAAAAAENRISGFRSPTVPSPQRGCPLFGGLRPQLLRATARSVCPCCGSSPAQPSGADAAESAPSPRGSSTLQQLYPRCFGAAVLSAGETPSRISE